MKYLASGIGLCEFDAEDLEAAIHRCLDAAASKEPWAMPLGIAQAYTVAPLRDPHGRWAVFVEARRSPSGAFVYYNALSVRETTLSREDLVEQYFRRLWRTPEGRGFRRDLEEAPF